MAEYIEREAFIADQRHLYCENCDRRRGMKDGKLTKRFVYAIGDAPCRACNIGDMLDLIEDCCPAADVVPVVRCGECANKFDWPWCGMFPDDGYCSAGVRKSGDGDA